MHRRGVSFFPIPFLVLLRFSAFDLFRLLRSGAEGAITKHSDGAAEEKRVCRFRFFWGGGINGLGLPTDLLASSYFLLAMAISQIS